jgi:hypothetical protein
MSLSPPPPYFLEENLPDVFSFIGFTVYGVSFFFALTEIMEHAQPGDHEYATYPAYMLLGLAANLASYALAFLSHVELGSYGHSVLTTIAFVMFAKHLTRRAELSNKRASTLIMVGALPLLCLAVLEAGTVRVRSARFFFALMLAFSAMPLPHLFREWLPGSSGHMGDVHAGKLHKRMFALFFSSFCFVVASTPLRQSMASRQSDARQSVVVFFDLIMAYYALDGLWQGSTQQH